MLYKIKTASINEVVGYMASHKMVEEYDYGKGNSVYNLNIWGKMDFVPDIDAIQILKRAKLMDIIVSVPVGGQGLIVSDKLLRALMDHVLPIETQIFDAYAVHKGEKHHYNYFYIYTSHEDKVVDWKRSEFYETDIIEDEIFSERYSIGLEDMKEKYKNSYYFKPAKLVFKKDCIKADILNLCYSVNGYFITQNVKDAIEEAGCVGVDMTPIDQMGFEVEFV